MEGLKRVIFKPDSQIKRLLDSIPNPSYIWQKREKDFILINYNNAAKKITHNQINNLLNQKAAHIHKDRPDIVAFINECFDKQKPISSYTKYTMNTTGQEVYISIYYYYMPPDLVIVHIKDLTKWKIAENELFQSKEKYKMLFELSPIPIILLDLNGKIVDYNQVTINLVRKSDPKLPILFLGTKNDLESEIMVNDDYALSFKEEFGFFDYLRISSKSGENVGQAFNLLTKKILEGQTY